MKDLSYYLSLDYSVSLQPISVEDGGGWLAKIPELEGCISDGETQSEAIRNLEKAKIDWLSFCFDEGISIPEPKKNQEEYSGRFTLRVGKSIHRQLTETAEKENVSVNNLVNTYIASGLQKTAITNELTTILNENINQ